MRTVPLEAHALMSPLPCFLLLFVMLVSSHELIAKAGLKVDAYVCF